MPLTSRYSCGRSRLIASFQGGRAVAVTTWAVAHGAFHVVDGPAASQDRRVSPDRRGWRLSRVIGGDRRMDVGSAAAMVVLVILVVGRRDGAGCCDAICNNNER